MIRRNVIAACLVILAGVSSGASAAYFVACQPAMGNVSISTNDTTKNYIIDHTTFCGQGDPASCCYKLILQIKKNVGGVWGATTEQVVLFEFDDCAGVPNTYQTMYHVTAGAGLYQLTATIANCARTATYATQTVQHTFP